MTPLLLPLTLSTRCNSVAFLGSERDLGTSITYSPLYSFLEICYPNHYTNLISFLLVRFRLFQEKNVATEEHADCSTFARQRLYRSMSLTALPDSYYCNAVESLIKTSNSCGDNTQISL